ncbi:trna wybutosine-synthesizing protein [Ophiostoma piceae UAMH 11346]|uniref:tRNA(Phe) 7-[(3-amino-3-carboxypropyl)-4-demethylwyosine(37)-N(4)]-methyltransferase n=1 Tax=Ophiostoma piceae (strain UAMH 11346) TaxID=1262450 RepID=S3CH23_OPHP1|nr:trna wybutosine-synthesizing protein [Ophiostoma piceae UAMH 11346]
MTSSLPKCPERFTARKAAILEQLERPDDDYTDASPKGTVDEGVRPLIDVINKLDGFVTTSSCAGRVAVFLEGRKKKKGDVDEPKEQRDEPEGDSGARSATKTTIASAGGKGGGGKWLFVSHDPLVKGAEDSARPPPYTSYSETDWTTEFGLAKSATGDDDLYSQSSEDERLVHFKFEPMILHVLTASLAHAQLLLRCASMAGFRESGAVSIVPPPLPQSAGKTAAVEDASPASEDSNPALPIVAVRSMGLALAAVVGVSSAASTGDASEDSDAAHCIVTPSYLSRLVRVADERFAVNRTRTERFRVNLVEAIEKELGSGGLPSSLASLAQLPVKGDGKDWEDAEARRIRKRKEGLRRQAAIKEEQQQQQQQPQKGDDQVADALSVDIQE